MEAIDGRLVFRAVKIERERLGGVEQPDAKPLAAAVWLQDDRAAVEMPPCRGDNRCIQGLFDPARAPLGWTPIEYPPSRP